MNGWSGSEPVAAGILGWNVLALGLAEAVEELLVAPGKAEEPALGQRRTVRAQRLTRRATLAFLSTYQISGKYATRVMNRPAGSASAC
jgi:hypothetical protein